jgi:hypothetical protein
VRPTPPAHNHAPELTALLCALSATGLPARYGFTSFDSQAAVDAAVAVGVHSLNGVTFNVRHTVERNAAAQRPQVPESLGQQQQPQQLPPPQQPEGGSHGHGPRMYVGGVPVSLPEGSLRSHFEAFGTVVDLYFPRDKVTNERKPFCFVTFDSPETAARALAGSSRVVDGIALGALNLAANRNDHYAGRGDAVVGASKRGGAAAHAARALQSMPQMPPGMPGMMDPAAAAAAAAAASAAMSMMLGAGMGMGGGMPLPMYGSGPYPPFYAPPLAQGAPYGMPPLHMLGHASDPYGMMAMGGMGPPMAGMVYPQQMASSTEAQLGQGGVGGYGPVRRGPSNAGGQARAAPYQRGGGGAPGPTR